MRGRDGPPDKRLFRRARQGDRQAFLLLLRRYDPRLRRLVLRLVAEPGRVDPILRRAYVKAWRSLSVVELSASVAEWLYRVVYNTCVNELRWAQQRPPPEPVHGPRVPLPVASAERRLAGLRALTPEERIPLALVDGEGFSLEATARILQRPPVAVAADLSRARGRWRSFVVGDGLAAAGPEAVELEPDTAAAEAQAEADDIGPADPEAVAPDAQPRHVRVVTGEGNGQTPSSPLAATQDAFGTEPPPDEPPAAAAPSTTTDATRPPKADPPSPPKPSADQPAPETSAAPAADGPSPKPPRKRRRKNAVPASSPAPTSSPSDGPAPPARASAPGPSSEDATGSAGPSTEGSEAKTSPPSTDGDTAAASPDGRADAPTGDEALPSGNGRRAAESAASGAGARRKRRRDAKRDVRQRARSGASKPSDPEASPAESDADAGTRPDESHEAT